MVLIIKAFLFIMALINAILGYKSEHDDDKHYHYIASDIFLVGVVLAILISLKCK